MVEFHFYECLRNRNAKMLWDISKHIRKEHPLVSFILVFCSAMVTIGLISGNVFAFMVFMGLLP